MGRLSKTTTTAFSPSTGCSIIVVLALALREGLITSGFVITAPVPTVPPSRLQQSLSRPLTSTADFTLRKFGCRSGSASCSKHEVCMGCSDASIARGRRSRSNLPRTACKASASSASSTDDTNAADRLHGVGGGGAKSRTAVSASTSAVISAESIEQGAIDRNQDEEGISSTDSDTAGVGDVFDEGKEDKADGVTRGRGFDAAGSTDLETEAGAPWTEFEDWLLQDTFSRYVIGSGKHVLWRRMVREVPELMERNPQEARQRWLRLTGRLDSRGDRLVGSPSLESFYLQPPVLEEWEEVAQGNGMGSFRGKVFGQKGLADGTAMTTAPVDVAGRRIQDQYVATQCGVVYELGEQRQTDLVGQAQSKIRNVAPVAGLAIATAFYAWTLLAHHIQVEVFVI